MKLSPAQQRIYFAMQQGARAHLMKGIDTYWFISVPGHRRVSQPIKKLFKLGLIKIVKEDWRGALAVAVEQVSK